MSNDRLINRDFGRYHVESLVDSGGMGSVYRARDTKLDRTVALKVLAERRTNDENFRQRFLRESKMLASIDHPNIVPVYEADEAEGELYIAMRFINGPDLGTVVAERGPLKPELAVSIISQIADALDYAHSQGLVHRDIKPANIMIVENASTGSAHAYLTDFGLTKVVGSSQGLTETGGFVGTSAYVAPEQIQGHAVDHRADIYSLGCVLFDLLTGTVPFPRDSTHASLWAHVNEPPPKPSRSRESLPSAFDGVISMALAKKPEDRYQTAGGLGLAARQALADDRAAAVIPPIVPLPGSEPVPPRVPAMPTEIRPISGVVGAAASGAADETAIAGARGARSTEIRPLVSEPAPPPVAAGSGARTEIASVDRNATLLVGGAATQLDGGDGPPSDRWATGVGGSGAQPPRRRRVGPVPAAIAGFAGILIVGSAFATGGFGLAAAPSASPRAIAQATLPPPGPTPSPDASPIPDPGASGSPDVPPDITSSPPAPTPTPTPARPDPPSDPPSHKPVQQPQQPPADTAGPTGGKVTITGSVVTGTTVSVKVTTKPKDPSGIDQIACSRTSTRPKGISYRTTLSCTIAGGTAGTRRVYVWFRDKSPRHNWSAAVSDTVIFDHKPVARNMLYTMTDPYWCSHAFDLRVIGGPGVQATDADGDGSIKLVSVTHNSTTYTFSNTSVHFGSTPSTSTQIRYWVDYTVRDTYGLSASGRLSYDTGPC